MRYTMKMRGLFVLTVCALGGCAASTASGPAWPKAATSDKDGGQSLAPQESRQVAVVIEKKSEEPKPGAAAEAKPAAATAAVPEVGVTGGAAVPPPIDETITTEDITIEIDD